MLTRFFDTIWPYENIICKISSILIRLQFVTQIVWHPNFIFMALYLMLYFCINYRKTSNISRILVGNKIVDNSDVSADRRCSNYIFILNLTTGFNGLGKDHCKGRQETFKFGDLVRLILEVLRYPDFFTGPSIRWAVSCRGSLQSGSLYAGHRFSRPQGTWVPLPVWTERGKELNCTVDSRYLAPVGSQNSPARVKWFSRSVARRPRLANSGPQTHTPRRLPTLKQYVER